jgi:hypothetical protein
LAHGVPLITTSIIAAQIGLRDGQAAYTRDDAQSWISSLLEFLQRDDEWSRMSAAAGRLARAQCSPELFDGQLKIALQKALALSPIGEN